MFECLILGDSIGLGTARAINERYAQQCEVLAAQSATAGQMLAWKMPAKMFGTSVLAAGSNDQPTHDLSEKLVRLRTRIPTRRVIWLLPYNRPRAIVVSAVAARFGDETLDLNRFPSRDRVHPANYRQVANALLKPPS